MPLDDRACPILLDYPDLPSAIDPDALIAAGRRSQRIRRVAGGAIAAGTLGAAGVLLTVTLGGHHGAGLQVVKPAEIRTTSGGATTVETHLATTDPPAGPTETLATVAGTGLTTQAIAYLDANANLCAGVGQTNIDPNQYPEMPSDTLVGTCSPEPVSVPAGGSWVTGAQVMAPATGSSDGTLVLFGFVGSEATAVSVSTLDGTQSAGLSNTTTSSGERVWYLTVAGDSIYGSSHQPITFSNALASAAGFEVTATDADGTVVGTAPLATPPASPAG
jgi:hypothetical protein